MIFTLHYIILNAGLPPVLMLMTLFLQAHSRASLSEIGTLLMALPFVSIVMKPLFCALADRHQAHRQYLMASLAIMALGYGSLTIAPFFPDFSEHHERLVWYSDILGIIVGYGAFGVVWSLGDTLAMNGAAMAGVSWGSYRMWSVVSWGVSGAIIGQLNELAFLPAFVPGMLLLPCTAFTEIVLLALWPRGRFVMGARDHRSREESPIAMGARESVETENQQQLPKDEERERQWAYSSCTPTGTLSSNLAIANVLLEDLSGTIKSTLKLKSSKTRKGLEELLTEQFPSHSSGQAVDFDAADHHQQQHATTALDGHDRMGHANTPKTTSLDQDVERAQYNIQLLLLKLIVRRDKSIWKYLFLFTLFGALMMCHVTYFFVNVSKLCQEQQASFALISGAMMMMHALGEVSSFLVVDRYIRWSGRVLALASCALIYLVRFGYYSFLMTRLPIVLAAPFEMCHGLAYAILYTLLCCTASECIDQVDELLPELVEHGLVPAESRADELKLPLRATMQGVFSGAFDGLGNGVGALFGGLFLDSYSFERLWQVCAGVCLVILVIYPLTEWQTLTPTKTVASQKQRTQMKQTLA